MANERWPEQLEQALTKMWLAGISASRIAEALGISSRGAVCGKANRLGLTSRAHSKPKPEIKSVAVERKPSGGTDNLARGALQRINRGTAEARAMPIAPESDPVGIGLLELTDDTCRYPFGEGPFTFCGEAPAPGSPYCRFHDLKCMPGRSA